MRIEESAVWRTWRAEILVGILAAAAVAVFLLAGIGRPIWHDDANAVLMARQGWSAMIDALRQDNNLPAYYILLSPWIRLFGESEPALRALSEVFYLAGAAVVFALGATLFGSRRAGFYAGVCYLASAQLIRQAQAVRMYTMLGFLAAASLLLFFRIFVEERPAGARGWAYLLVSSVGMLTQVWFFFVLLGEFLFLLLWKRDSVQRFAAYGAAAGGAFAVLWGPAFLGQLRGGATSWLPPFRPIFVFDILAGFFGNPVIGFAFLALCATPVILAAAPQRAAFFKTAGWRVVATSLLACLALPLAVSIVKPIYFPARYSTAGLPALAALLGAALAHFPKRPYALAALSCLLLVSLAGQIRARETVDGRLPPGQSDRATVEYLLTHASPGDWIIFTNLTRPAADYYLRRHGQESRFHEITYPQELSRHPGWLDSRAMRSHPDALNAEAAALADSAVATVQSGKRVWVYSGLPAVTPILQARLDARMRPPARAPLQGPFHEELLVYAGAR